MTVPVDDLLL